jgi:hypothetical protein
MINAGIGSSLPAQAFSFPYFNFSALFVSAKVVNTLDEVVNTLDEHT